MAPKQYVATAHTVQAEQYTAGMTPPAGVDDCEVFPPGGLHAHTDAGTKALHETDWLVWNDQGDRLQDVIVHATFVASYEPPRPLQEIEGLWVCSVNVTIQNPTNGQIRFNTATVETSTILALHKLTDANIDYSAALETAVAGDVFYIQSAKDARRWARFTMTADAARTEDAWYRVPVAWTQGSGQSFIEGNNKLLINLELSHRVDRTQVIP